MNRGIALLFQTPADLQYARLFTLRRWCGVQWRIAPKGTVTTDMVRAEARLIYHLSYGVPVAATIALEILRALR